MKNTIVSILFIFLFYSCGKKQGDIEIKKFEDNKTVNTPDTSVTPNKVKNEIKSSGKNETQKQTENYAVQKISSKEAASHINQNAVVTGYVADVTVREKVAYLNFDFKYPKNTFSGVIFKKEFDAFGDLSRFRNKNVEINGVITEYSKKPQIILNLPSQIKIIK